MTDIVVIGGGPAGLSAAIAVAAAGSGCLLLERQPYLGGILPQCIHTGFGEERYGDDLTGPEYAARLIAEAQAAEVDFCLNCAVINIVPTLSGVVVQTVSSEGNRAIVCRAVILASGCRERAIGSLPVTGTRPAGVFTAGTAQKLINCYGWLPGRRAVILGSGDIGLIMARRLFLEGVEVLGVLEKEAECSGLLRNRVQCLDDFAIPLHTGATICRLYGSRRLTGVRVRAANREYDLECDTLLVAAGLIPETDLWPGPPPPWLFLGGNARQIQILADNAAEDGQRAGLAAARYVRQ
ncbi:MAG: NAD(P)/FAD-dependent oxidoreductase [Gracilibacteraceae bacterium]|nr:NAD(P)/FAD-dependent oxidoreductase [Gracilibacteraceae bacterium]